MGEGLINYNYLGSEECPIDPTADEIEYSMIFRIGRIEKLEQCSNLRVNPILSNIIQRLGLRKNLIKKIEGLENNLKLEELELYDNRIRVIENLSHLTNLVYLDLSFNRIKVIEGLETLVNVRKLYLVSNRIKKVSNCYFNSID